MAGIEGSELQSQRDGCPTRVLAALRRNLAWQDYILVGLHSYLTILAFALPPHHPDTGLARGVLVGLLAVTVAAVVATRGELLRPGPIRAGLYRFGLLVPAVLTYFALRWVMRALDPPLLDAQLLAIDRALLGGTPAVAMQAWVTPAGVEWFAFFYSFYFVLIALHVIGTMLFDEGERGNELLCAAAVVVAVGHTAYTIVPGVGPYVHMAKAFTVPLTGGPFWALVQAAVARAGVHMDIFPSLHTAFPTLFALHAFRHRRTSPYRWTWLPTAFVACNMVGSTMFLRWHYGVDVLAGLALALLAHRVGVMAVRRARGRGRPGQRLWEPLRPATMSYRAYAYRVGAGGMFVVVIIAATLMSMSAGGA